MGVFQRAINIANDKLEKESNGKGALVQGATSELPVVTAADNGKVLKVVDGVWTAVAEVSEA